MRCTFCNKFKAKSCSHINNSDIRSRMTKGHLRKFSKRCAEEFCPLDKFLGRDEDECPLCNKKLKEVSGAFICKNKKCKIYMDDFKIITEDAEK